MNHEPRCVLDLKAELAEGPIWSPAEQAVWFVDIKAPAVHRFTPSTAEHRSWPAPEPVGFVAPIAGGGFVAGLKSGLHHFDPESGAFSGRVPVDPPELGNRLNDAFVDPAGRLWFGSMHDAEESRSGALHRLDGPAGVTSMDGGYCITNGPACSPDARTFYHTDTLERVVYAFDLSPSGELSNRRDFVRIDRAGAYPDGSVVDAEGCVWIALWGGWGVERYSPDGRRIGRIELPCANVTKACFGGPELKTLFLTTARKDLGPEALEAQPLAGGLFAVDTQITGLPQNELVHGL